MNSTGNKLKVNAASEGKLNSHEQRNNDGGLNKLNSEDWMKFSLIQEWMKWITKKEDKYLIEVDSRNSISVCCWLIEIEDWLKTFNPASFQ